MRVLVTGATGFLGSNLAGALVSEGHHVRILRRPTSSLTAIRDLDVEHTIGDIRDPDAVRVAVRGCDMIFHAAALVSYWRKQRAEVYDINIGGTANIIDACLRAGVQRLIHTSSVAAVGFEKDGVLADESTPFNWDAYDVGYRISKHRGELEVLKGVKAGLPAVIVNPSIMVGERDIHFIGGQIVRDVYKKRIFYSIEGGISVVYVGDVVRGHLAAARQGRIGERYILSGENLTHRQILETTADVVSGWKPLFRLPFWGAKTIASVSEAVGNLAKTKPWIGKELVAGLNRMCWFSCEKAKRELGYSVTPFRTAIERTFEWYGVHSML
ncbi:MAG: SDR family oxidoreductase [Ignavibacteriales bacterium]|nr:SDR family oxidoreductase [Ignavibacteriales bacterium]